MSKNKRSLTYWTMCFIDQQENPSFNSELFADFLQYIKGLDSRELLINDRINYRAEALKSLEFEEDNATRICKVVMKSCKYNHSPDFMSSEDGSERPSNKTLSEGDEELTHLCMRLYQDEAYVVFEQRVSGVSFSRFTAYLNHFYKAYKRKEGIQDKTVIDSSAVLVDDFESMLERAQRITSAELYTNKRYLGSDFLNLMPMDISVRNEVAITLKAERLGSISKDSIRQAFLDFVTGDSKITRMRLRCKDIDDVSVMLDTINMKKKDEISVNLNSNGIVDTTDILEKMKEIVTSI